jgi:hypothetical protein
MEQVWEMSLDKRDLVEAIGHARTRATLRRKGGGFEADVTFVAWEEGLSIRSSFAAMDLPAEGRWCSPVMANGAALRRVAPKLAGPRIALRYEAGRLFLNATSIPAREI